MALKTKRIETVEQPEKSFWKHEGKWLITGFILCLFLILTIKLATAKIADVTLYKTSVQWQDVPQRSYENYELLPALFSESQENKCIAIGTLHLSHAIHQYDNTTTKTRHLSKRPLQKYLSLKTYWKNKKCKEVKLQHE